MRLNRSKTIEVATATLAQAKKFWNQHTQDSLANKQINWDIEESQYNTEIQNINDTIEAVIEEKRTLIKQLLKELGSKVIVQASQNELNNYLKTLEDYNGLDLPVEKYPTGTIKKTPLISDQKVAELIDKMAETQTAASQWYGLNGNHVSNTVSHYATWSDKSSFNRDLITLKEHIKTRLAIIKLELDPKAPNEECKDDSLPGVRKTLKNTRNELELKVNEKECLLKNLQLETTQGTTISKRTSDL